MDVVESMERVTRLHPLLQSRVYSVDEFSNVYTPVEALMKPLGLIGVAEAATMEATHSIHSKSVLIVDYDAMVATPEVVLAGIYAFLGLEPFRHDFANVRQIEHEAYDSRIGILDLHKVASIVEKQVYDRVLPPDIVKKLQGRDFWRRASGDEPKFPMITLPPGGEPPTPAS